MVHPPTARLVRMLLLAWLIPTAAWAQADHGTEQVDVDATGEDDESAPDDDDADAADTDADGNTDAEADSDAAEADTEAEADDADVEADDDDPPPKRSKADERDPPEDEAVDDEDDDAEPPEDDRDRLPPPDEASSPWTTIGAGAGGCVACTAVPAVVVFLMVGATAALGLTAFGALLGPLLVVIPFLGIALATLGGGPVGAAATTGAAAAVPYFSDDDTDKALETAVGGIPGIIAGVLALLALPCGACGFGLGGLQLASGLLGSEAGVDVNLVANGALILSCGSMFLGASSGLAMLSPTLAFAGTTGARLNAEPPEDEVGPRRKARKKPRKRRPRRRKRPRSELFHPDAAATTVAMGF